MEWLPSLIGGVSSLIGAGINSGVNYAGAELTNRTNKEIANLNNETMIKLMREQTKSEQDYNSISAQMLRAMAAGVNPMLLAGAQPTSASAASVPSLQAPDLKNPFAGFDIGLGSSGAAVQSGLLQAKELELKEGQLDNAKLATQIDMLKSVVSLVGNSDLTADDINNIIQSVMGDHYQGDNLSTLFRDQFTITRIQNAVITSNLEKDEKQYLFDWLDEFTNAQFTDLLASTELKQTQSVLNRSLEKLNNEKRKEVTQAIKNMQEQWKSLSAQSSMDAEKTLKFARYFEAQVKKLEKDADISEQDAKFYFWNKILEHPLYEDGSADVFFGAASASGRAPAKNKHYQTPKDNDYYVKP